MRGETAALDTRLVYLLTQLQNAVGFELFINSGYRSPAHNTSVGGVKDSAHTSGLAVDIRITDSRQRMKLVLESARLGIRRIGIGHTFVHVDIDETKPLDVMWDYYPAAPAPPKPAVKEA